MNIRVVREAGGIGDIVRIIPALRGLRKKYPEARLWLAAPNEFRALLDGWYDEFIPAPLDDTRRARDSRIDEEKYAYLQVRLASGERVRFDLDISLYCPAFRHEADARGRVWTDRIELFCRVAGLTDLGADDYLPRVNLDPRGVEAAEKYIAEHGLRDGRRLIALQPFSTDPGRNWAIARWLRLAAILAEAGHQVVWLDCCGRVNNMGHHAIVNLPLSVLAPLLARCDLLIGPDSGLAHLAAAVDTPCVGLFASQSGAVMFRHYPRHTWIYPNWDGQSHCPWPCFWVRRPDCRRDELRKQPGQCCPMLARITAETVAAVALRMLTVGPETGPCGSIPAMTDMELHAVRGEAACCGAGTIEARDHSLAAVAIVRDCPNARATLREAFRVLTPGGILYTSARTPFRAMLAAEREGFINAHSDRAGLYAWRKVGTFPFCRRISDGRWDDRQVESSTAVIGAT